MDDLYVKPEYKANGIGTQLIHEVIKFAKGSYAINYIGKFQIGIK